MRAAQRFISTGSAVLVAIVGSGAVLLGTTVPAAASSPVPSSVPTLSSTAGPIIFGLGTHTVPERLATEAALGKKSGIVGSFANKTSSPTFWGSWARQVHDEGAVLQLYWDPTPGKANDPHSTLRAVLAGEHDAYIRSWARQVADVGYPVIIRLWAEMNGNWQPTSPGVNGNTAPEFVLAWRHVVNLARESGANNILWNWNPDKPFTGSTSLSSLWPGGSYVDWIGLDVYNSGSSTNGTWKSFSSMMGPAVSAIRAVAGNKPLMIPEIGCGTNGDKAGWLHDMYASLSSFGVKAVVYFDYDMRTIEKSSGSDWRFSSPSSAMAAAKVAVHKAPIVGAHDLSVGKIEQLMARRSSLTPVADYTGDGKTDTATWRPTDGTWNVPGETPVAWGLQGDIPVDGDYTGGGKSDLAI